MLTATPQDHERFFVELRGPDQFVATSPTPAAAADLRVVQQGYGQGYGAEQGTVGYGLIIQNANPAPPNTTVWLRGDLLRRGRYRNRERVGHAGDTSSPLSGSASPSGACCHRAARSPAWRRNPCPANPACRGRRPIVGGAAAYGPTRGVKRHPHDPQRFCARHHGCAGLRHRLRHTGSHHRRWCGHERSRAGGTGGAGRNLHHQCRRTCPHRAIRGAERPQCDELNERPDRLSLISQAKSVPFPRRKGSFEGYRRALDHASTLGRGKPSVYAREG